MNLHTGHGHHINSWSSQKAQAFGGDPSQGASLVDVFVKPPKVELVESTKMTIFPIGSMYAIYGNIYHQYTPNVSIGTWSYPLVNVYITMERSTIFNGKIHYKYLQITLFNNYVTNYQRVSSTKKDQEWWSRKFWWDPNTVKHGIKTQSKS